MRPLFLRSAIVLAALATLVGCRAQRAVEARSPPPKQPARSLLVTASLVLGVAQLDEASNLLRAHVAREGGFIAEGTTTGEGQWRSAHFEVRVPVARFELLRASLAELGTVASSTEKVEDVTEARTDLKARLRNSRVQETRLLALLQDRTGTLADVIAVEKELASVREAIERLEAQDQDLDRRVELATVMVTLQTREAPAWTTPLASVAAAARSGLKACATLLVGLCMALAATAPTLLSMLLIGWGAHRTLRALRRRVSGPTGR